MKKFIVFILLLVCGGVTFAQNEFYIIYKDFSADTTTASVITLKNRYYLAGFEIVSGMATAATMTFQTGASHADSLSLLQPEGTTYTVNLNGIGNYPLDFNAFPTSKYILPDLNASDTAVIRWIARRY